MPTQCPTTPTGIQLSRRLPPYSIGKRTAPKAADARLLPSPTAYFRGGLEKVTALESQPPEHYTEEEDP